MNLLALTESDLLGMTEADLLGLTEGPSEEDADAGTPRRRRRVMFITGRQLKRLFRLKRK